MYQLTSSSKNSEMDSQILFRIFSYRLHQLPGFDQHLIGIVEQCRIPKQLARGTFAGLQTISHSRELAHGVLQLSGKLFVLRHYAQRSFASVYVIRKFLHVGDGLVGVVVESWVLEKLAGASFA